MNKTELVDAIAGHADITKAQAHKALEAFLVSVTETLKKGDKVTLIGFGVFETRKRAERKGRNPRTKEEIKIPASITPAFKVGKKLKEALNPVVTKAKAPAKAPAKASAKKK